MGCSSTIPVPLGLEMVVPDWSPGDLRPSGNGAKDGWPDYNPKYLIKTKLECLVGGMHWFELKPFDFDNPHSRPPLADQGL